MRPVDGGQGRVILGVLAATSRHVHVSAWLLRALVIAAFLLGPALVPGLRMGLLLAYAAGYLLICRVSTREDAPDAPGRRDRPTLRQRARQAYPRLAAAIGSLARF